MIRSKEIPAMIIVTITGADERMYDALKLTIQRENRKRKANHEEPIPYIINQSLKHVSKALQEGIEKARVPYD